MAKEKAENWLARIKRENKEGGGGGMPAQMVFIPKEETRVFRFVSDFEGVTPIKMHNRFKYMFPQPCLGYYGKKCPFCNAEGFRDMDQYAWTVYDYEMKAKKVLVLQSRGRATCMDDIIEIYETNKTLTDRDIKIKRTKVAGNEKYKASVAQGSPTPFSGNLTPFTKDEVFAIVKGLIRKVKIDEEIQAANDVKVEDNGEDPLAEAEEA